MKPQRTRVHLWLPFSESTIDQVELLAFWSDAFLSVYFRRIWTLFNQTWTIGTK